MRSKVIIISAILCAVSTGVKAQDFQFGVRGGLSISSLGVDPQEGMPNPDPRLGIHLGAAALLMLDDTWGIQPELTYSTQGAKFEEPDEIERVKVNYLNLNPNARLALGEQFYLIGGPQLGFMIGGDFEEEDKVDGATESLDADNFYKSMDLGINLGAGYILDSGLEVSVRYLIGLTDNNDDPIEEGFFDLNQSVKNRGFQISLTYWFQ